MLVLCLLLLLLCLIFCKDFMWLPGFHTSTYVKKTIADISQNDCMLLPAMRLITSFSEKKGGGPTGKPEALKPQEQDRARI